MNIPSKLVSIFTIYIFRKEWKLLRYNLVDIYQKFLNEIYNKPSVFAQQLLISGEDHRFFSHGGVDVIAVFRAIWCAIAYHRVEGASTIEMQIVRIITGRFERTFRRKIMEMCLATLLTSVIPKKRLPSIYLYISYYGWRMNHFNAACLHLKLCQKSMSPISTARLVARLKYPQPHFLSIKREQQIEARAFHLLRLYERHKLSYIYKGIPNEICHEAI